jgi:RNA polymerase sigma factor (sigma-70 family)
MKQSDDNINLADLVKKAQCGCRESMDTLARQAESGLFTYIYRLTLNHSVAEDIKQETLLEIVKSLKRIEHPERFNAWLYRTALGKVQHYFRDCQNEKTIKPMSTFDKDELLERVSVNDNGLKRLISKELSEAIVDSMGKLKLSHRNVLVLRCYDNLPYSKIAEIMDCSEFAAQVLFFRAKAALKKKLSSRGFGKGMLLGALGMFGIMTDKAGAAVNVSASSVKVGLGVSIIGTAITKLGLTILGIIATIGFTIFLLNNSGYDYPKPPKKSEVKSFHYVVQDWEKTGNANQNLLNGRSLSSGAFEQWYFFPDGVDSSMFVMIQRWAPQNKEKLCGWLVNASGNYTYNSGNKTIYIVNYHVVDGNCLTFTLPTDTTDFVQFTDDVEGSGKVYNYIRDPATDIITRYIDMRHLNEVYDDRISFNTIDEKDFESFRYKWPDDANVEDFRDQMHKRGWTYFRVTGKINGLDVQGKGRIPFIYNELEKHSPWLNLNVGGSLNIIDGPSQAYLSDKNGNIISVYPPGSFTKGLNRPWMGMHTIDTVRRDAAEKRIRYVTQKVENHKCGMPWLKLIITLFPETTNNPLQIKYTVSMHNDAIEKIEFTADANSTNSERGFLEFTYLQDVNNVSEEFIEPAKIRTKKSDQRESMGILWLKKLAEGTLGQ